MSRFLPVLLFSILSQWLSAQNPATFIKRISDQQLEVQSQSMCPTADGNFYLAGKKDIHPFILKINPDGEVLWMRSIPIGSPNFSSDIVEILEDSEGKIVFCSNQQNPVNPSRNTYIMRFDPVGDTLIWFKITGTERPVSVSIVENGPGGNFFLSMYKQGQTDMVFRSEIWELNRNTGLLVNSTGANQYANSGSSTTQFQKILISEGNIFAAGGRRIQNSGPFDPILSKIAILTDKPEWARRVVPDTTTSTTTDMAYHDMVFDSASAVMLGNGFKDALNPSLGRYVYLGKHDLNGHLIWLQRYDIQMIGEDVLSVPDGYVVFGKMFDNEWCVFKTDKNGQLMFAKTIKTSSAAPSITGNRVRQGQLIRVTDKLLMTDYFKNAGTNDIMLVKSDLNLGIEGDSCELVANLNVTQVTMPAGTILFPLVTQTRNLNTGDGGVIYEDDALTVCGMCPLFPCCEPDIAAKAIDSVFCSSGSVRFNLRLCNEGGSANTQALNVTLYNSNPFTTAATALFTVELTDTLKVGECKVYPLDLDLSWFNNPKLYILAGSKGDVQTPISIQDFPLNGGFLECTFTNNIDSITLAVPPLQKLDLGPDRNICAGQSVTLDAGSNYIYYQWQGGPTAQTYTVSDEGSYFLQIVDGCGRQQFDTIRVRITAQPKRTENFVLLPGESVVINGKTYTQTTTFTDTIPSNSGSCDTLLTYNIRLDALHCPGNAEAFYQVNYTEQEENVGRVLLVAADGSIYTAGESYLPNTQPKWTLTKSKPNGELLWSRKFESAEKLYVLQMIEDSEGNLVGTIGQIERIAGGLRFFRVFRYNPNTDQMLWIREIITPETMPFPKVIAEKTPGGNFALCYSLIGFVAQEFTEYAELDRNSGQLIGSSIKQFGPNIRVLGGLKHQNKMMLNGLIGDAVLAKQSDGFAVIDLATGTMTQKRKLLNNIQFTPAGGPATLDSDNNIVTLMYSADKTVYLRKTTIDGDPIWLKSYDVANVVLPYTAIGSIAALNDGYAFLFNMPIQNSQKLAYVLVKTDKNGQVVWSKKYAVLGVGMLPGNQALQVSGDDLYVTGVTEFTVPNGVPNVGALCLKVDKDGHAGDNCNLLETISLIQNDYTMTVGTTPNSVSNVKRDVDAKPVLQSATNGLKINTLCSKCEAPCDTIRTTKNITFYPGDTIVIDGKSYTQSDTVLQSFITPKGCDSIVTNILQLVVTKVDISCPADLTVTLPPNTSGTVVDYNLPKATTDCPDPKITLKLIQGFGVGGIFPIGVNTVCYEASNTCNAKDTCCFRVTVVNPETPCDFKNSPSCLRYELLSVKFDAKSQRRYRIRLSNTCASPVQFVYIQSPNGVNAVAPAGGSVFTATPSGRAYEVRNPNASPFASIRFKAQTGGLKGGANDIFEYTLPQQSAPVYILVGVRLENGEYFEAYLNTFNCPAQPYDGNKNREEDASRPLRPLTVFPNPTTGMLYIDFSEEPGVGKPTEHDEAGENEFKILIVNSIGQVVYQRDYVSVDTNGNQISLVLQQGLANGMYLVSMVWPDGRQQSQRFVLKR